MLNRLVRTMAVVCLALGVIAWAWRPNHPRLGLGIVGGGLLMGLSIWAIRDAVEQVTATDENGKIRPVSRGFPLVKFFTRHAILALAAYGMMLRLHLDPVGMLVGVSSVMVAAAAEATRGRRPGRR
jgi:hypothetical protein